MNQDTERFSTITRILDGQGYTTDSGTHGQRGHIGDYLFAWLGATTPFDSIVWKVIAQLGSRMFPFGALPELANLLRSQWEKTLSLEIETGQTIPTVFHWNDKGTIKPVHPKALYHRWKKACKRAGVPRSVAMKLTGHETEAVYRRYAIVCEADLTEGLRKLALQEESLRKNMQPCGTVTDFSHSSSPNTSNDTGKYGGGGEI